jgi:hypothetical protein
MRRTRSIERLDLGSGRTDAALPNHMNDALGRGRLDHVHLMVYRHRDAMLSRVPVRAPTIIQALARLKLWDAAIEGLSDRQLALTLWAARMWFRQE